MPCSKEESLKKEVLAAIHQQNLALNPNVERVKAIGGKQLLHERDRAKTLVENAEREYNAHILQCEACKQDRRVLWRVSDMT
jgi:hypothetical protein